MDLSDIRPKINGPTVHFAIKKLLVASFEQSVELINKKYMKRQRETINSTSQRGTVTNKKLLVAAFERDFFLRVS
jgi:hypothetical protein